MAVTKTLTKAVPAEKNSKVEEWNLEMTYDEASEYFDFNIAGSNMGVYTPLYLET